MVKENLKITGRLKIVVTDKSGKVKDTREVKNLVVTAGKEFIASAMVAAPTQMTHMGLGSGTTAPAAAQTALTTELGRVALSSAAASGTTVTYTANFVAGVATGAVTEAGIFNAASAGTMLCRTTFAVLNKGADDSISITWQVTVQ